MFFHIQIPCEIHQESEIQKSMESSFVERIIESVDDKRQVYVEERYEKQHDGFLYLSDHIQSALSYIEKQQGDDHHKGDEVLEVMDDFRHRILLFDFSDAQETLLEDRYFLLEPDDMVCSDSGFLSLKRQRIEFAQDMDIVVFFIVGDGMVEIPHRLGEYDVKSFQFEIRLQSAKVLRIFPHVYERVLYIGQ